MASKLQAYTELSQATATRLTSSYQEWTAFLCTAGRLYKYPFPDQMLIYAQRPEATACAEYDFWNEKMRRYVLRGSSGIALIDTSGDKARLRYVFDVADTAELENARRPQLWQYRPEHQPGVAAALEERYGVSGQHGFATQIEAVSALLSEAYWDENQEDLLHIVDGSVLEEYDRDDIREQFMNAACVSIAYTVMSRCGLEPESYFSHEDFMGIFDFSTVQTATALGMAVSQSSEQVLRQIEVTIRAFEREKRKERSSNHGEHIDVQPERGLHDSEPDAGGPALPAPGQVRENAPEVSEGVPPDLVGGADGERETVLPPAGNREDGQREAGPDDARAGEVGGGNRGSESQRSIEVGGLDEHLQGPGGGNDSDGAGVQLSSDREGQLSLFPSEQQQIEAIQEAESAEAPSAPSISEGDIDNLLRQGTGFQDGKLRIYEQYQKGISKSNAVKLLKKEYGTGGGSYTFLDGTSGFVNFQPAKGFVFWWTPRGAEITVSWTKVEKRIRQLIQEGNYLNLEELESYRADHQERPQAANGITNMDVDKLLVEDFGATGRKQRIFALFQQGLSDKEIAGHLRAEYNQRGYGAEERAHEGPCVLADGGMGYGYFVAAEWRLRRRDVDGPMRCVKYEEMARHIRALIDQGRYLPPEEIAQITPVPEPVTPEPVAPKPESAAPSKVTQADIDAALQGWNGDAASKRRVQQYMIDHAREKDTAAWLRNEYGDDFPAFPVNGEHSGTDLSWAKVQRHLARLVKEDRFFTGEELENFADVDTAAVREALAQDQPSPFVEQVKADVERLAELSPSAPSVREGYEHYKPLVKERVLADTAYRNACANSDRETALLEGNEAVKRAAQSFADAEDMTFVRLYFDMAEFRSRLHREIIDETYSVLSQPQQEQSAERTYVVDTVPTIFCEWSESHIFEDGKTYSVSEFDRLMKQADGEFAAGKKAAMEKYGTWQKWYDANDADFSRFLGYDKVKFTLIMPDGRTFTERQDIGDGDGGVLDFLSQYEDYREIVPILRQAVQAEQELSGPSGQPVTRDGDTITIESGEPAHEVDITPTDEESETAQKVIGAADRPPRDPLAPAYQVGDTVYLEKKPYVIADIYPSSVSLQDVSQTYPIFRSESKDQFESLLILSFRNRAITEYLPANVETCDQDMREVAASHLLTDRDKYYISGWFRGSKGNSDVAHLLSELFASRAETVELATGEKADYFTSTTSLEINILDDDNNKKAVVTGFWSEVAALLRALWLQALDGFAHEPPPLEPAHLEGTPSYAVGDHVVVPTYDRDISGTIEYIGEFDVRIDTGPYAWSHQTVNKDFFEDALRQDERNAGLFVREASVEEVPAQEVSVEAAPEAPTVGNFRITDDNLGVGGARAKYRMNVEAIRTLKQIEMEGRSATAEEQEILSRYVGWGGVSDAFDKNKTDWLHEYDELKELLTPEEYKSAMASTINAHYTTGKTEDALEAELSGVIFRDIECEERADWIPAAYTDLKKFRVVSADEYLSGNVRRKLRMAKAMYEALPDGEKYKVRANVEALEAAQPKDLDASEIDLRLGATWLDKRYVQQFMYELFQTTYQEQQHIHVEFSEYTGEWRITGKSRVGLYSIAALTTYGTSRLNAYDILEDTLNLRDVRVYDTVREGDKDRRVLNQKETTLAVQKQQMIKDAFRNWIWKDPARRQDLVRQYNELFNSIRPREYDGRHIVFGGINPEITLREHQINAIAHTLYGGNTLLAHEVGAGKTFEMVAAAMESKRLGLCSKSLFVVPNHLIEQWAGEFLRLYPSANILVTRKKDFEKANRKKFCARIATGNYDAVIMGHSQFTLLPVSEERKRALLEDQIAEIEEGIQEMRDSGAEQFTVKQLEGTKKKLMKNLKDLTSNKHKDDVVTFEQLGVDRLFVDEAHAFKNLFLYTKMRNVAGLSTTDAQKSSDMFLKCRYLDEITGGRGVVFATGTPVSNSMTELFTMQRYLQQNLLEKGFTDSRGRHYSLTHFDSWASIFGETVTTVELAPEGKYRPRTRFARFFNLPELMAMFRETADIKTADQLRLPVPEVEYHTVKALPSEEQKELVKQLAVRAADIHGGHVDPKIDNMLAVTNDGRKLGLDQRLINPLFPDNPESKVNLCVNNVFRIWKEGQAEKLTQLLFCDLSTPKAAAAARKDKTAMAAGNKTAGGTELHALGNLLKDIPPDPPFSVYEDIRAKLISIGIPKQEIAFIHDADTESKKKALFAKVRSGQVRVLMGSTFKMGAGMNVQDRLIALHDLDCPWRPGDDGRTLRTHIKAETPVRVSPLLQGRM